MSEFGLGIEPSGEGDGGEVVAASEASGGVPLALAAVLPPNFPLQSLLAFMPDVRMKAALDVEAEEAMAMDVRADGLAAAERARNGLRERIAAIEAAFKDPTSWAYDLHKRLTGLRADFTARGREAAERLTRGILDEDRRLKTEAAKLRAQQQAQADAQARERAQAAADTAARQAAPPAVVEALQTQAARAVAPPVSGPPVPTLASTTVGQNWKVRVRGTTLERPDMADLIEPEQREQARLFFKALGDGTVPLAYGAINWSALDKLAGSQKHSFEMPGLEAYDKGKVASRGRR